MPTPSIVILLGFLALAAGQVTAFVAIMNAMNKRFDDVNKRFDETLRENGGPARTHGATRRGARRLPGRAAATGTPRIITAAAHP